MMIGTKIKKPLMDLGAYSRIAEWCNNNHAMIDDKGEFYEVVEIPEPTAEEIKANRIAELKRLLADTDYAVIKIAEGEATKEEYAETLANRRAWRIEINDLEAEENPEE
jgi:hypothetical protein